VLYSWWKAPLTLGFFFFGSSMGGFLQGEFFYSFVTLLTVPLYLLISYDFYCKFREWAKEEAKKLADDYYDSGIGSHFSDDRIKEAKEQPR
jgi:hypothetical protein